MNKFKKLSIKNVISLSLLGFGVMAILMTIISSFYFKAASKQSYNQTMQRIINVAVEKARIEQEKIALKLAFDVQRDMNIRNIINYGSSLSDYDKQTGTDLLNAFFKSGVVGKGQLELKKLRVYDKQFNLLFTDSESELKLQPTLQTKLKESAQVRKGGDRFKPLHMLWKTDETPLYSTLVPMGGMKLKGYLEIISDPVHHLKDLSKTLNTPVMIQSNTDETLFVGNSWIEDNSNYLNINYPVIDTQGNNILTVVMQENMETFYNDFSGVQYSILAAFVVLTTLFILLTLKILGVYLFNPLTKLVENVKYCSDGDLTVEFDNGGLVEIGYIRSSLKQFLEQIRNNMITIRNSSEETSTTSEILLQHSNNNLQKLTHQNAEIDMVATAVTEMNASAQEVAKHAVDAAEATNKANKESQHGKEVTSQTMNNIEKLNSEVNKANDVINELQKDSESIGTVLEVIKDIADQTNLLALNAAIEAARAGEVGRGFAVVADEVRTLANRTAESTVEIQTIIEKVRKGANGANDVMKVSMEMADSCMSQANQTLSALESITSSVSAINQMNTQVALAAEEQGKVSEELNINIISLKDSVDEVVDSSKIAFDNSDKVHDDALTVLSSLNVFKI